MDVKFMVNEKYSFKLSNYARDLVYYLFLIIVSEIVIAFSHSQ